MEEVAEPMAQPHTEQGGDKTGPIVAVLSLADDVTPKQDDEEARVAAFISEGNPNASEIE